MLEDFILINAYTSNLGRVVFFFEIKIGGAIGSKLEPFSSLFQAA